MLFRTATGFVEINKYDFKNDKLYYKKIMEIKNQIVKTKSSSKLNKTFNDKNN
jgi:hypothetical protein